MKPQGAGILCAKWCDHKGLIVLNYVFQKGEHNLSCQEKSTGNTLQHSIKDVEKSENLLILSKEKS